ncbi:Fmn2: Formin-2 [Crotalus adamanteus]|uniref:Fmn2: Formin-2 n=1 Tax=Crotalus adamanteus TaxID=8729 RepID=A0AAW1ALL2_CROAD
MAVVILTTVPAVDDNSDIGPPVAKVAIGFLSTQIPAVVLPGPDVALVIPATTPSVGPNPVGLDLLLPPWAAGDLQVLAPAVVLLGPDMTLVIPPLLAAVGVLHPCPDGDPKITAPTPETVLLGPAVVLAIPTTAPSVEDDLAIKYTLLPPAGVLPGGDVVLVVPALLATVGPLPPCPDRDLKISAPAPDIVLLGPDMTLVIPALLGPLPPCPDRDPKIPAPAPDTILLDRDPKIAAPAPDIVFLGPDLTLLIPALLAAIGPLPLCPDGDPKIPAPAPDAILLGPAVVLAILTTALSVDLEVLPP